MPVRFAIPVAVEQPALVRPQFVHALMCECLERDLAPTRHHGNDKPFSTSPLRPHQDGIAAFEVGLLDDEWEERLYVAIAKRRGCLQLWGQMAPVGGTPPALARGH